MRSSLPYKAITANISLLHTYQRSQDAQRYREELDRKNYKISAIMNEMVGPDFQTGMVGSLMRGISHVLNGTLFPAG